MKPRSSEFKAPDTNGGLWICVIDSDGIAGSGATYGIGDGDGVGA